MRENKAGKKILQEKETRERTTKVRLGTSGDKQKNMNRLTEYLFNTGEESRIEVRLNLGEAQKREENIDIPVKNVAEIISNLVNKKSPRERSN